MSDTQDKTTNQPSPTERHDHLGIAAEARKAIGCDEPWKEGDCFANLPEMNDHDPCPRCHLAWRLEQFEDDASGWLTELLEADGRAVAIDAAHIARQREFSTRTFGPGSRAEGVVAHIRKELDEIAADPGDVVEWADVVILALDGAWREGHEPQAIIDAIVAKQARNEARTWPDWREAAPGQPIEHVRGGDDA